MDQIQNKTKRRIIKISGAILFLAVFFVLVYIVNRGNTAFQAISAGQYVPGVVESVLEDNTEQDYTYSEGLYLGTQKIKVKITGGEHKGEIHEITNSLSTLHNVYAQKGTRVMLLITPQSNGSYQVSVYSYDRSFVLAAFVMLFFAGLCIISGKKGVKAVAGLIFTIACIVLLLIPLVARGYSPVMVTVVLVAAITVSVFILLDGICVKTVASMISTMGGVLFAGICSLVVQKIAHLSGFQMDSAENLLLISSSQNAIHIKGLLTACILIAALGAVMDVAMSISSAVCEVYEANHRLSFKELFTSGMNVGRDAMGTMANTLILAFAGSSLNLLLLVFSYGIPFYRFLNTDQIAIEILQAVGGSLGIISAVPIAAAVVSGLICRKKGKNL